MSKAAVHITGSNKKQFQNKHVGKKGPKRTLNVMMMYDGMDMHPEKNVSRRFKLEQKKKRRSHICNRGTGQKRRQKATTEKSGFREFLDENDLR